MQLLARTPGDQFTMPGHYGELERRLRQRMRHENIPTLIFYAFDNRTRLGPFVFIDKALIPGAPLAIAAALSAAGFSNQRIVLQQWSPHVLPSMARLDGSLPQLLLVSSMQIHSASACRLIQDAWKLGPSRPLIVAGGAKAIYEPWDLFGLSPDGAAGADVVVTGEEYVLLELLDRILAHKSSRESLLRAFQRVRAAGLLADIPGLVYRPDASPAPPDYLVSTGVQRLVRDLDELPMAAGALSLFEPPHRRHSLAPQPVAPARLNRCAKAMPLVTTHGCKFHCPFCPIPAYNQFTFRNKSPERLVADLAGIVERTGISFFFGTDDNFFNHRQTAEEILTAMSHGRVAGKRFRDAVFFGTEGTVFDVYKNRDLLPLARDAGLRAIWLGIEDLTGNLIKKGQDTDKTGELFQLLLGYGIAPMPMMIHHDRQPLVSRGTLYGLLNQVAYLRRAGAVSVQVTCLMPSVGSKGYEQPFEDGLVMSRVGGRPVEDYQYDGNHCIATNDPHPWRKQLNVLLAYASFYNPWSLLASLLIFDELRPYRLMYQTCGLLGVAKSLCQGSGWLWRLMTGPIERYAQPPRAKCEIRPVELHQLPDRNYVAPAPLSNMLPISAEAARRSF